MPHHDSPPRNLPVVIHPIKLGLRCPVTGCSGTLVNHERRWWLRCTECQSTYLEDE